MLQRILHATLLFAFILTAPRASAQSVLPVQWTPRTVQTLVFPGQTLRLRIAFETTQAYSNVAVDVVPALGILSATPTSFALITPNTQYAIDLNIVIPASQPMGSTFTGTIHLKTGTQTLARPISLLFDVEAAAFRDADPKKFIVDAEGAVYPVNQMIVFLKRIPAPLEVANTIADSLRGTVVGFSPTTYGYQIEAPFSTQVELDAAIASVRTDSRVDVVLKNYIAEFQGVRSDIAHLFACNPEAQRDLAYYIVQARPAWDLIDGLDPSLFQPITLGIVDTGILRTHPEFAGVSIEPPMEQAWSRNDLTGDEPGHGTAVAGIIGANNLSASGLLELGRCTGDNVYQMNGILSGSPKVRYTLAVSGTGYISTVEFAPTVGALLGKVFGKPFFSVIGLTELLAVRRLPVINLSIALRKRFLGAGGVFLDATRKFREIVDAYSSTTLFVVAAGNDGGNVGDYTPANLGALSNVLTVAATDLVDGRLIMPDGDKIVESSSGPAIGIAAPGKVWAPTVTYPGWGFGIGTSFSAPLVSGTAGVLKAVEGATPSGSLSPSQIKNILVSSGDDITTDKPIGGRRLNVCRAVLKAIGPPPPQLSSPLSSSPVAPTLSGGVLVYNVSFQWSDVSAIACGQPIRYELQVKRDDQVIRPLGEARSGDSISIFSPSPPELTGWTWALTAIDPFNNRKAATGSFSLQPAALVNVTPSPYNFGSVVIGSTARKDFTIINAGNGLLTVSNIDLAVPSSGRFDLLLSAPPFTIGPGGTAIFSVFFNPSTAAVSQDTVRISSNALGSPGLVVVSGTGVAPATPLTCSLSASPASITVGNSSTLTWTTTGSPASASIVPGIGAVTPAAGGSVAVAPTATTAYTLTVTTAAGSGTCAVTVTVNPTAPFSRQGGGPPGGRVGSVTIDPHNPDTLYAATGMGGVFKSNNGGATWSSASVGIPQRFVGTLVVNPLDPSTIYAATDGGVFKSRDYGATWSQASSGLYSSVTGQQVSALAIDTRNPSILYAGAYQSGVFKTLDGGMNWTPMSSGLPTGPAADTSVVALAIDPSDTQVLYAGTWWKGIYKSIDGGQNWAPLGLSTAGISSVAVDPSNSTTIYAGGSLLYKSVDGGQHWNWQLNVPVNAIVIDPRTPTTVYAATSSGVFRTVNGGTSWSASATLPFPQYISAGAVALDPQTSGRLYIGTQTGVHKSEDGGQTWKIVSTGITALDIAAVLSDPANPLRLHVATWGSGLFMSDNGGDSWTLSNDGSPYGSVTALAMDPSSTSTIYAGGGSGNVLKSTDGGVSWTTTRFSQTPFLVRAIAVDPADSSLVYLAATGGGVIRSIDGGQTWSPVNTGLATANVTAVAVKGGTPSTVYIGTWGQGVFKSTDAGQSWVGITVGLTDPYVDFLAIAPSNSAVIYVGGWRRSLFRSSNGGESWSNIGESLPASHTYSLAIHPADFGVVYVAVDGPALFKSSDGGQNWISLGSGLSNFLLGPVAPTTLGINRANPMVIYLGTGGAGVFRSLDGGASWQPTQAKWGT